MPYRCTECGNTDRFYASAREYHTWVVDGNNEFVEDNGCDDADNTGITSCVKCGSYKVESYEEKEKA